MGKGGAAVVSSIRVTPCCTRCRHTVLQLQCSGDALQCTAAPCMQHGVCSRCGDMTRGQDAGTGGHTARRDHDTAHVPPRQPTAPPTCRCDDHEAANGALHAPADPQRQLSAVHQLWPGHGTGPDVPPRHLRATSIGGAACEQPARPACLPACSSGWMQQISSAYTGAPAHGSSHRQQSTCDQGPAASSAQRRHTQHVVWGHITPGTLHAPPTLSTLCLAPGWSSTPSACSLYQLSREAGLAHSTNLQGSSQGELREVRTMALPVHCWCSSGSRGVLARPHCMNG